MAFWNRFNRSKLKLLISLQFRESYPKSSPPSPLTFATKPFGTYLLENPYGGFRKKPMDFCNNVRRFAAPVQVKPKGEESVAPILNDKIKSQYVRLVTEEGHNIVSTCQALEQAKHLNLDLVMVQGNSDPPVCKIFNFKRVQYEQKKKKKEKEKLRRSQSSLRQGEYKEVRFSGKTELKDLKMKADAVKNWMERGYRVKCVALSAKKGNASQKNLTGDALAKQMEKEQEEMKALLASLTNLIEDESIIESGPEARSGQAFMIVRHVKFGLKNRAKKLTDGAKGKSEDSAISDEDGTTDGRFDDNLEEVYNICDSPSSIAASASPREPEFPSLLNHRLALEQTGERPPRFPSEPSPGNENRYRSTPRNQLSPCSQIGLPSQGGQPPLRPPTTLSGQQLLEKNEDNNPFHFGTFSRAPPNKTHRVEPTSPEASKTPVSGYGIFSPPKVNTPGIQDVANEENNRYGSQRTKDFGSSSMKHNNTSSPTYNEQRPGSDLGGQGAWGVFSRDGPTVNPNRRMPK